MNLAAKASAGLPRRSVCAEAGYAMAALLVGMSVMAVMLSVAMPTWSQMIRREKEEELIFRGTQYARAFALYQSKFANASPANIDVLVEQRMLRKKFRDPLSPNKDGEFALLYMSNQPQGAAGGGFGARGAGGAGGVGGGGMSRGTVGAPGPGTGETSDSTAYTTKPFGPIMGVASKNTGASIRVYKGKQRYNEWYFVGREGGAGGAGGAGGPAGRIGGRGGDRGGRGGRDGGPFGPGNRGGTGGGGRGGAGGGFGGRGGAGGGFPGSGGPVPSPPR